MLNKIKNTCASILLSLTLATANEKESPECEITKEETQEINLETRYFINSIPKFENTRFTYDCIPKGNGGFTIIVRATDGKSKDSVFATYQSSYHKELNQQFLDRQNSNFFNKEIDKYVKEIFEIDVERYSKNLSNDTDIQKVLAKRGIDDPKAWFEQKIRGDINNNYKVGSMHRDSYDWYAEQIRFSGHTNLHKRNYVRTHEASHKISHDKSSQKFTKESSFSRVGFSYHDSRKNNGGGYLYGTGLNEEMTNWFANIMLPNQGDFPKVSYIEKLVEIVGRDKMIEAYLFEPKILENELTKLTNNENTYRDLIVLADTYYVQSEILDANIDADIERFKVFKYRNEVQKNLDNKINARQELEKLVDSINNKSKLKDFKGLANHEKEL